MGTAEGAGCRWPAPQLAALQAWLEDVACWARIDSSACACPAVHRLAAVEVILLAFLSLMVLPVYALTTAAGSHSAESGKPLLAQPAPAGASRALLQPNCVLLPPFYCCWPHMSAAGSHPGAVIRQALRKNIKPDIAR